MDDIDVGDTVRHLPTGETWTVGLVKEGRLYWIGYPFGGSADLEDCVFLSKSSPEYRDHLLRELAGSPGDEAPRIAARQRLKGAKA